MLRQRIVTAVILLIVLVAAMAAPSAWPFMALLALAAGCAGWEWLRLTLPQPPSPALAAAGGVAIGALCLALTAAWTSEPGPGAVAGLHASQGFMTHVIVPLAALLWVVGALPAVIRGRADAPPASRGLTLFAFPALLATWAALALLFMQQGAWFVVSLLILVWAADIAAYFGGRAFGRRKLAPRVSPGKTMEGALCGVAAGVIWIGVSSFWEGTYGYALARHWGLAAALPLAALLAVFSIVGDLFESLLKRRAGRKDSSALLPGHGGVFDRIDAVLPVAPIAFLLSGLWA